MTYSNQCSLKKAQAALGAKAYSLWLDVETGLSFNIFINGEGLVAFVFQHKINTLLMYEVERKSTCWLMNSRKPSNWQVHQLIKLQSQESINYSTHQPFNSSTI